METYVSIDIETDGPHPVHNSILQIGAAAFTEKSGLIETWTENLKTQHFADPDPDTMAWWMSSPENAEAYNKTRINQVDPAKAMVDFRKWILGLPGHPVPVAYPSGYDFTWIYYYLLEYTDGSPFQHKCIDIRSFGMGKLGCDYHKSKKSHFPKKWRSKVLHTHQGLDDAIGQGELFINMLRDK